MYIIAIAFLTVFSLGMAACVMYLIRVRRDQSIEIMRLQEESASLVRQCRSARKTNRDLRRLSYLVSGENRVLRQELRAAHQNLAMVLDNHRPLMAGNVGVEIGRHGVYYTFTHNELLEPSANLN